MKRARDIKCVSSRKRDRKAVCGMDEALCASAGPACGSRRISREVEVPIRT